MSDFVVHKSSRKAGTFARHYCAETKAVYYSNGNATAVELADGQTGAGSCVGCASAPCMEMDESEMALPGTLDAFPGDPSRDVCPTKAIHWSMESLSAHISADKCIGCGLCIARCPYGAISLVDALTAHVETTDPDDLVIAERAEGKHPRVERSGHIASLDAPAARNLLTTVAALDDARTTLLVRNLLNEVGLNARTRRRGDTNMRIDAVGFSRSERPFVAEIETGAGVLESPRALLEDVAVLHSRYGYDVAEIDPVSVILAFPNVRSEYYQVIRDIEKVLGLRCRTITVGALIALLWSCAKLEGFDETAFAMGSGIIDLADSLGLDAERMTEPYSGAFRPAK